MDYPKFTKEMKTTHTILLPTVSPVHMKFVVAAFKQHGYNIVLLENSGSKVMEQGLKYVHNDTCYPALLIIGQFLDALNSGEYDLDKVALVLTQTGGGCRASNYIHLLRKALQNAGFGNVPVASLNFSGLEKDTGIEGTLNFAHKLMSAVYYGDLLQALKNQTIPYEITAGETDTMLNYWTDKICEKLANNEWYSNADLKNNFNLIAKDFAQIKKDSTTKVKVGIVGEIYVKYSPIGNNDLEEFLISQDCEVNLPGLIGFLQYIIQNTIETVDIYGGSMLSKGIAQCLLQYIKGIEKAFIGSLKNNGYHAPLPFDELKECANGIISRGNKMGEGWLLTAEMVELVRSGYENIVCAQPFGCLPNHICGRGMIARIRDTYPIANITSIDYDPSATKVNQENRIKLMIAIAKERLS